MKRDQYVDRAKKYTAAQLENQPDSVKGYASEAASELLAMITSNVEKTESPVEAMFLIGTNAVLAQSSDSYGHFGAEGDRYLSVIPQYPVKVSNKHYRVDFAFTIERVIRDAEADDGYNAETFAKLFVEIDGFDYHDKTKEQATHDKQRERMLLPQCDQLIRFSGSEVYQDPEGCALEALRTLERIYLTKQSK